MRSMALFRNQAIILMVISVTVLSCYPDDESVERMERSCSLDGVYSCDILTFFPNPNIIRNMTKTATLAPNGMGNTIDIDVADLGGQGYRYRITRDLVTNGLTITAAPGAANAPYTQINAATGPPVPGWPYAALINNTYDPVTCTFYIRSVIVGNAGWRLYEEVFVKQ